MVIAVTVLVLVLIATVSALVAASVTRRAAALLIAAAVAGLDPVPAATTVRPIPTLDRALDDL